MLARGRCAHKRLCRPAAILGDVSRASEGADLRGVLMIAAPYSAPDQSAIAAGIRARALAQGLHDSGHRVTVVCADRAGARPWNDGGVQVVPARYVDVEASARRVGVELRELRTGGREGEHGRTGVAREIAVRLAVPDRYVIWVPAAIAAARRVGANRELVVSTGPVSAHLVARTVVRGRPWLADCNDLWSRNPDRTNGRLRDAVDAAMEHRVLRRATRLTTVSEPMREELEHRHGKPVTVLYSGFEAAEFPPPTPRAEGGPRRLLFAGTLYGKQDLTPLLRTLASGRREGWLSPDRLEVSFIGRLSDRAALEADRFGVADFVTTSEPIPRDQLLRLMVGADALLLPSLHDTDRNALPMKLFEYIGARRPIIVFGPGEHLAASLVAEHGFGVVLPHEACLRRCLRDLIDGKNALLVVNERERAQFSRDTTLATLASVVDEL
jgi:glycosyltransferase involved in cell wall biosynthesis